MKIYLALDGTVDVDAAVRCRAAARLGYDALVCELPAGMDPDDLPSEATPDEGQKAGGACLEAVRGAARTCLASWLAWMETIKAGGVHGSWHGQSVELAGHVARWIEERPEAAGEIRAAISAALGFTEGEYAAWLGKYGGGGQGKTAADASIDAAKGGAGAAGESKKRGYAPLGPARKGGAERPVMANFAARRRWRADPKGLAKGAATSPEVRAELAELRRLGERLDPADADKATDEKEKADHARFKDLIQKYDASQVVDLVARDIGQIREDLQAVLLGWPHRIRAPGAQKPLLFADRGTDEIDQIADAKDFLSFVQDYAQVRFNPGQDDGAVNYVQIEGLYKSMGRSEYVPEWTAIEQAPHEPEYPDHYYCWKPPAGYTPNGERLAEMLAYFDNLESPEHRALMAAAIVTPFWGGPYGQRPAFVFDAFERGSGKTYAATMIAKLVDRGGALAINLDKRSEERLKERLLSPEGLVKRVALVDNLKGAVSNELLEELVTCEHISGKRLAVGEASRPNTLTFFITANNAQLSPDMTSRSFFLKFRPLNEKTGEQREKWMRGISDFIRDHGREVVADCLWALGRHNPGARARKFDWQGYKGERWPLWCTDVLAAVLAIPAVAMVVGEELSALDVLRANQAYRNETDIDIEEAEAFMAGLLERVCAWRGWSAIHLPVEEAPVFIRTVAPPRTATRDQNKATAWDQDDEEDGDVLARNNMVAYWKQIFARRDINGKWLVPRLRSHIEAGRLRGLRYIRRRTERGWELDMGAIKAYLAGEGEAAAAGAAVAQGSQAPAAESTSAAKV